MENLTSEIVEEIKKGYITGFFDAEGTVGISKDYALHAQINQAHKPVLEKINNEFKSVSGVKVHSKEGYDKRGVHHKGSWMWRLFSDDALPFLKYVHTYSIEKRPQVELAIKYQETTKFHSNSRTGSMFRLSQTEIERREWFKKTLEELKDIPPTEQELRSYDNEIKKLSITKDIRDGKQKLLFDTTLEDMYKQLGIDTKEEQPQTKQQTTQMPKYVEIGYLSGFMDGEGYITISKGKRDSYTLRVAISNTNFNMLKMYETKFGGKIRPTKKVKEHHKEKWQWNIDHNDTLPFLKLIQQFCIVKSNQIDLAIEFQNWHNYIRVIKTAENKRKAEWYYNTIMDMKKEIGEKIPDDIDINNDNYTDDLQNGFDKYMMDEIPA